MAGRIDVARAGVTGREPERVGDAAGDRLVVADETGEDRQAGGIRAGPAGRPQGIRLEVPGRAAAGRPSGARLASVVELVQPAGVLVDHEDVAVRPALDEGVRRDRIADTV